VAIDLADKKPSSHRVVTVGLPAPGSAPAAALVGVTRTTLTVEWRTSQGLEGLDITGYSLHTDGIMVPDDKPKSNAETEGTILFRSHRTTQTITVQDIGLDMKKSPVNKPITAGTTMVENVPPAAPISLKGAKSGGGEAMVSLESRNPSL